MSVGSTLKKRGDEWLGWHSWPVWTSLDQDKTGPDLVTKVHTLSCYLRPRSSPAQTVFIFFTVVTTEKVYPMLSLRCAATKPDSFTWTCSAPPSTYRSGSWVNGPVLVSTICTPSVFVSWIIGQAEHLKNKWLYHPGDGSSRNWHWFR